MHHITHIPTAPSRTSPGPALFLENQCPTRFKSSQRPASAPAKLPNHRTHSPRPRVPESPWLNSFPSSLTTDHRPLTTNKKRGGHAVRHLNTTTTTQPPPGGGYKPDSNKCRLSGCHTTPGSRNARRKSSKQVSLIATLDAVGRAARCTLAWQSKLEAGCPADALREFLPSCRRPPKNCRLALSTDKGSS